VPSTCIQACPPTTDESAAYGIISAAKQDQAEQGDHPMRRVYERRGGGGRADKHRRPLDVASMPAGRAPCRFNCAGRHHQGRLTDEGGRGRAAAMDAARVRGAMIRGLKFEIVHGVCGGDLPRTRPSRMEGRKDATSSGFSRGVARGAALDAPRGRRAPLCPSLPHALGCRSTQRVRLRFSCDTTRNHGGDSIKTGNLGPGAANCRARGLRQFGIPVKGHTPDLELRRHAHRLRILGHPFSQGFRCRGKSRSAMTGEGPRVASVPTREHTTARGVLLTKVIPVTTIAMITVENAQVAAR